jgi:hypothetical protein
MSSSTELSHREKLTKESLAYRQGHRSMVYSIRTMTACPRQGAYPQTAPAVEPGNRSEKPGNTKPTCAPVTSRQAMPQAGNGREAREEGWAASAPANAIRATLQIGLDRLPSRLKVRPVRQAIQIERQHFYCQRQVQRPFLIDLQRGRGADDFLR